MNFCPFCGENLNEGTYCPEYNIMVKLSECNTTANVCRHTGECPIYKPLK